MNILFSYWHMTRSLSAFIRQIGEKGARIMMDSGAFTVYKQGERITLGEYTNACRELEPHLFSYIMLDVIRQKEQTKQNLDVFLEKGLRPMPVWTTDSNMDDLAYLRDRMLCNKLCVAGGATEKIGWYGPRLKVAREFLGKDAFIHALGFTSRHVSTCPIDSVDSSSYKEAGRFGTIAAYTPEDGLRRVNIGNLKKHGFSGIPRWAQSAIIDSGLPENLGKEEQRGIYSSLYLLGVSAWMDFAKDLRRHGIRLFFAVASELELCPLALVAMHKRTNGSLDWEAIRRERQVVNQSVTHDIPSFVAYFEEATCRQELLW